MAPLVVVKVERWGRLLPAPQAALIAAAFRSRSAAGHFAAARTSPHRLGAHHASNCSAVMPSLPDQKYSGKATADEDDRKSKPSSLRATVIFTPDSS